MTEPRFVIRLGEHAVYVAASPNRYTFYARCSCGWQSQTRMIEGRAVGLGETHARKQHAKDQQEESGR